MKRVHVVSARDNVATALDALAAGQTLEIEGRCVNLRDAVPAGHKVAIAAIPSGSPVIKYGNVIGTATSDILAGAHVHTHNLASSRGRGDLEAAPAAPAAPAWSNE